LGVCTQCYLSFPILSDPLLSKLYSIFIAGSTESWNSSLDLLYRNWKHGFVPLHQEDVASDGPHPTPIRVSFCETLQKFADGGALYDVFIGNNSGSNSSPMLMFFVPDKQRNNFLSVWPPLVSADLKRRSRSPSQTCTPSPGHGDTRSRSISLPFTLIIDFGNSANSEYRNSHCCAHERQALPSPSCSPSYTIIINGYMCTPS
jgi:hypothetical protein